MSDVITYEKCLYCGKEGRNLFKWSDKGYRYECTYCGWNKMKTRNIKKVDYYGV